MAQGVRSFPWMHYRHYWKLIVSVVAFSILCIALLSTFSYAMFMRTTMGEYSRIGEIEVARMNETFNSVVEEATSLAYQLLGNKDAISTCLYSAQVDYLARYYANRLLKTALASNRYLSNISLINLQTQSYLHPNAVADSDISKIIRINREAGSAFLRIFCYTMDTSQGQSNQLLLSINPRSSSAEESHAAIILWIDANRLLNRMLHKDDHDSAIALTNGNMVFARTNTLSGISESEMLSAVRARMASSEQPFALSFHGNAYLTFCQPVDMMGWHLVYMYRANPIPARSQRVLLTGLLGVALFALAVLIAILYVRRLYRPIGVLMEHLPDKYKQGAERADEFGMLFTYYEEMTRANTSLSFTMQNLQGFVKQSYLHQLLQSDQRDRGEIAPIQDMLSAQIRFQRYQVVLLDVWSCDESEFASRPILPQMVVLDQIRIRLPEDNVVEVFVHEDDRLILIAGLDDKLDHQALLACCSEIARGPEGDDALELCVCVGDAVEGIGNIGKSYKSALQMAADSFLLGSGRAIGRAGAHRPMPDEAACQQFVQQLLSEIRDASIQGIRGALYGLHPLLLGCSRADAIEAIQRIMRMLIARLDKNIGAPQRDQLNDYIRHLGSQRCLDDVIARLSYFLCDYANAMSNKALIEQYELVEHAKRYAGDHYADCNLHIDDLAKELGVSPVMLGNLFKQNTGVAYYKYVNDVRLKHAERLLLETDLSVIEISHSVGILNYTYFFTLFKKKHHVSPKIYRGNKVI